MSLTTKGDFKVGGVEFSPKSLKINYESLQSEDTGRTDDGKLHIYWVYRKLRKLEIEMAPMTSKQVHNLLSKVQGKEYDITYFDVLTNAERTSRVYTSNSSGDCFSGVLKNGLYTGVSFHAIEIEGE